MKKIWFDVEFNEFSADLNDGSKLPVLDPISIGMIDEDGNTYMAVFEAFNQAAAQSNRWLMDNVVSKLPDQSQWKSAAQIRQDVLGFVGDAATDFRYWYAPQDAVILHSVLADSFLEIPKHINGFPFNIAQKFNEIGTPHFIIPNKRDAHEVLADAEWTREFELAMDKYALGL